jgi:N6-adenosine-specific RNA methylase IME4
MTIPEIEALSVADIAAEDAYLLLWSTKDHLIHGESASVMRSWGFNVKSVFTWLKTTKAGDRIRCGVGHYGRNCTEFVLVGTKGSTPSFTKLGLTNIPTAFMAPRGQHSEKPPELFDIADRLAGALGGDKVELFARKVRPGWTSWGAEI